MKKAISIIIFILLCLTLTYDKPLFTKFYYNPKKIENGHNLKVLVNKNNFLDKNFIPNNLESISTEYAYENKKLIHEAKVAFEKLSMDAKILGFKIIAVSAYRDYDYQYKLYNYYVDTKGLEYADKCSARPGHSEHQTGLAVDVMGSNLDYNIFEDSIEFNWMQKNAYKYGFILRYPKGKEHITGFKYEPWHYRYVGIKIAKEIYENNLTLEEYLR